MTDRFLAPHQARRRAPTAYENRLGDLIERAYADGAQDLEDLVQRLNDDGLATPSGQPWSTALYRSELAALAG